MSQYVYVIEELDPTDQTATAEFTPNASDNAFNYNLLLDNNQQTTSPTLVAAGSVDQQLNTLLTTQTNSQLFTPINSTCTITGAQLMQSIGGAQIITTTSTNQVLAQKKVDLNQLTAESTQSASNTEILVWPQYRWHCFLCSHSCDYFKILTNHLKDCHNILNPEDVRYKCSDCGRVIEDYAHFLNHIRQQHHPYLKTSCDVCSRTYERFDKLAKHREVVHNEHGNSLRPVVYNCSQCELVFATKAEVNRHCENHVWNCQALNPDGNICNKNFYDRNEFYQHKKNHPTDMMFKCPHCNTRFETAWECQVHKDNHHVPKGIVHCKFCPFISNTTQQYVDHLQMHGGTAGPRQKKTCYLCGEKFDCKSTLMDHMRVMHGTNNGAAQKKCSKCGKAFTSQNSITQCDCDKATENLKTELHNDSNSSVNESLAAHTSVPCSSYGDDDENARYAASTYTNNDTHSNTPPSSPDLLTTLKLRRFCKSKRGRPRKTHSDQPDLSKLQNLSESELRRLTIRAVNNESSRISRLKQREREDREIKVLEELQARNKELHKLCKKLLKDEGKLKRAINRLVCGIQQQHSVSGAESSEQLEANRVTKNIDGITP